MFLGVSILNLDSKGRLAMPSKYRERLLDEESGEMVLTIDRNKCIFIFPRSEWISVEEKLRTLPSFDKQAQLVRRMYMNFATEVKLDAGGRILIPQPLRDHAELDKKVVLSGQGQKFEAWSESRWNEHNEKLFSEVGEMDTDNVSDALKSLVI